MTVTREWVKSEYCKRMRWNERLSDKDRWPNKHQDRNLVPFIRSRSSSASFTLWLLSSHIASLIPFHFSNPCNGDAKSGQIPAVVLAQPPFSPPSRPSPPHLTVIPRIAVKLGGTIFHVESWNTTAGGDILNSTGCSISGCRSATGRIGSRV